MSESKFTPGPWDYWSGYNSSDRIEAQVTAEGGDIVIASYNHLIEEGEANAKLIATAPYLLAALVSARDDLKAILPMCPGDYIEKAIASADAVISKATA